MASQIAHGVLGDSYYSEDQIFTFTLTSGMTTSDVGKAVALDTATAKKVKLAGNGDLVFGRLESVENRVQEGILVGAVAVQFIQKLPIKSGLSSHDVVVVGSTVVGAGSGEVKAKNDGSAPTPDHSDNIVLAVTATHATVLKK